MPLPGTGSRPYGRVFSPRLLGEHLSREAAPCARAFPAIGIPASQPDASLYTRSEMLVTFENGRTADAWVYCYNAPLGKAELRAWTECSVELFLAGCGYRPGGENR